jgi:hypothetical protein
MLLMTVARRRLLRIGLPLLATSARLLCRAITNCRVASNANFLIAAAVAR